MSTYRKNTYYRKTQWYRGGPFIPAVSGYGMAAVYRERWGQASIFQQVATFPIPEFQEQQSVYRLPFNAILARQTTEHLLWNKDILERGSSQGIGWGGSMPTRQATTSVPWSTIINHQLEARMAWADHTGQFGRSTSYPWRSAWNLFHEEFRVQWKELSTHSVDNSLVWKRASSWSISSSLPWGPAGARQGSVTIVYPVEPPEGVSSLVFPDLPVYLMRPALSVVVLPDRIPLQVMNLSLASDKESWAWTFNATVFPDQLGLVNPADNPAPVELEITGNGYVWNVIVERYQDNRRFGQKSLTLSGSSPSRSLADPYAIKRSYYEPEERTAAQLAADELIGTDWELQWNAVDWVVPANTFSYEDMSPMDAILKVASTIGATVRTHPSDRQIVIDPSYEVSPWNWDSTIPYAIIPVDAVSSVEGDWEGGNNATGVYVWCATTSYSGFVKIAGESGAQMLPMVVDPLAVSADPVRERGRVELAKAGRKKTERVTLPLLPPPITEDNPGLIPVGKLIQVNERSGITWRGMVTGTTINFSSSQKAFSVRQILTVERQWR